MLVREIKTEKTFTGRLPHNGDLLEEIRKLCEETGVRFGALEALGAVKSAKIAVFNQKKREYAELAIDEPLEIAALLANISEKEGKIFIHAHVVLSKEDGSALGGHLIPGTPIFACEFVLRQFDGPPPVRKFDEETGLALWQEMKS